MPIAMCWLLLKTGAWAWLALVSFGHLREKLHNMVMMNSFCYLLLLTVGLLHDVTIL